MSAAATTRRTPVNRPMSVTADPKSDAALVSRCLQGDQRSWNKLVDRYGRLVCATARSCGFGQSDAEDIMQMVFTQLFRRLASVREGAKLSAWMITTTRRACWRATKHKRRF